MPLNINSCLYTPLLRTYSFVKSSFTSKRSTQSTQSSGGYVTTSTKVKISEIKPRTSYLDPKLRIDFTFRNESVSSGVSDTQTALTAPISALDDDDTDFVPFEEFEQWRLQQLKDKDSTTSSDSDTIPACKPSERSAFSVKRATSTDYDIPRKHATSADYDIPRKHATSTDYDIPKKHATTLLNKSNF